MAMNPRLLRPILSGDPDANRYIAAVQAADQQSLEPAVRKAFTDFIVGCKQDGIWSAIKASCILAGARTLAGALVPLVGTAPTNNNFVSGDYNRETGLVGDGSTKYLNSNRNNNADPQNSNHNAVYQTQVPSDVSTAKTWIGSDALVVSGANNLAFRSTTPGQVLGFSRGTGQTAVDGVGNQAQTAGFIGHSRSSSSAVSLRVAGTTYTGSSTSTTPQDANLLVFARTASSPALHNDARIAFYSIGESLDLALLDSRVSTLITAIGAAIP